MSVYTSLISVSREHAKLDFKKYSDLLRFDLDSKSISHIMENGKMLRNIMWSYTGTIYDLTEPLIEPEDLRWLGIEDCRKDPYAVIAFLYQQYKTSVPNKHTEYSRCNFKAKHIDELSMEEIMNGMKRETAKYILEGYILFGSLQGWFGWHNNNHFFKMYQGTGLVLFKNWMMPLA